MATRHVRYSDEFLRLVHRLTERGVEHAQAVKIARETLGELHAEPTPDHELRRERVGRTARPRRVGLGR